ncbi:MAG: hypothetical protein KR126chlam2_00063 [Chlamydiae bacterium]|nr:hypothetical protein [Chlamydiota bacterium]
MRLFLLLLLLPFSLFGQVKVGIDVLMDEGYSALFKGKRIGLISNQTAVNHELKTTFEILKENSRDFELVALFAPEHGFYGDAYAYENVADRKHHGISLYNLNGDRRRPTKEMLTGVDLLVYDIQDIGSRSYSYISTLFYAMEEAAKLGIKVIVLDRPNPLGGKVVDGPLVDEKWRSFIGYVNVPYCHGMTIGELSRFFNETYHVGCDLEVIPMRGWKRSMIFKETGLVWVPTSPQIPEEDTPFFYPTTGLIGHCSFVNIGIGYSLPFKLIGAPWINGDVLADRLNKQKLPGVCFQPFYFRPFFGKFKLENCQGVKIIVTDPHAFLPVTTQYTIMGILKTVYPKQFDEALKLVLSSRNKRDVFNKLNGSEEILHIICNERYFAWKLREKCKKDRELFLQTRKKYLNPLYS